MLKEIRSELVRHIGGRPSATQAAIIEQIAQLRLRITLMDHRFAASGALTDHDSRTYLAWCNTATRLTFRLGLKGKADQGMDLGSYLAARDTPAGPQAAAKPSDHPSEAPAP